MRRRITLYIGDTRADLADDALILFNWQLTDITNPAAVRNSFSREIDLPRTDTNSRIFGSSFRLDRLAGAGGTGAEFNASLRTPFTIFAETGEVLAAGYCKLTGVTRDAFKVALYGGLGDFLYGLSTAPDGRKLTLADLDYGEDLDFTITADTVAEAWARLEGDATKPAKWDIINFAPAYNGTPDDFEAGKAVARPEEVGLSVPSGKTTKGGYVLVNLQADADEWAAHDLRSYLQRPVVSVAAILDAIANPANNGGWSVDLSDIAGVPYRQAWLTRPLLPSLGTYKQAGGAVAFSFNGNILTTGSNVARFTAEDTPVGSELTVRMQFQVGYQVPSGGGAARLLPYARYDATTWYEQLLFLQAVAYDSDGVKVAAGPSLALYYHAEPVGGNPAIDSAQIASLANYQPDALNTTILPGRRDSDYNRVGSTNFYLQATPAELEVTGTNIARVEVIAKGYFVIGTGPSVMLISTPGPCAAGQALWAPNTTDALGVDQAFTDYGTAEGSYVTADSLRSGAKVTKAMLLSTEHTPADYLVSFCKLAGLALVCDAAAKSVKVLRRATLYNGPTIDLTRRVDRSQGVEITPLTFDRRWYEWKVPPVGGRFEEQYRTVEGVDYGVQRVDTGYEFDAEARDVLSGIAFNGCAAVLDRSLYWFSVLDGTTPKPSLFRMPGNTFTVWDTDDNSEDVGISVPSGAAVLTPYNVTYPGYDTASRAEFRDAENGPVDGVDVLLFHTFATHFDGFSLSDDLPVMDAVAGGPCWLLGLNDAGLDIPQFTRYTHQGQDPETLLDFGFPREIDIPGINYNRGETIYEAAWAQYVRDRLSVHCKVLKARVDLSGLQAGPELLRAFYWYEGSLWVLSAIRNHSLTTFDPAECEFIQVRDTAAYTNGQTY